MRHEADQIPEIERSSKMKLQTASVAPNPRRVAIFSAETVANYVGYDPNCVDAKS